MILTSSELVTLRQRPHRTDLFLSIYKPTILIQGQINDASIARDAITGTYDNITGSYLDVEEGMTLLVGTAPTLSDVGKVRIQFFNGTSFVVAQNSDISWQNGLFITVLNYVDIWTVFPRIVQDPSGAPDEVIFYKDYDIPYDPITLKQNEILGSFPCAGPHRAAFLEAGTGSNLYWTAEDTETVSTGTLGYAWEFEGGTPSTSAIETPGWVNYVTPGHYKTKLTVTNLANGGIDVTYRFVSIYDRENAVGGGDMPIVKWDMNNLSGSRAEGGYNASIKVWEHIDDIQDNSLVVIFADDWYGNTEISLGGNAKNCSKIMFVGYVMKGSIQYNYRESSAEFTIGSVTELMRQGTGFGISCDSVVTPTTWFEIQDLNIPKALYHYLRWHSTVLKVTDFQYTGDARKKQYFDTDNTSMFDAIDNFLRTCLSGELVTDRQGKLWAEISMGTTHDAPTIVPVTMIIDKQDWMDEPSIEEKQMNDVGYLEMGGVSYDGPATGIFNTFMSEAPGRTHSNRGNVERIEGLTLIDQAQLNNLTGDLFAYKNAKYTVTQNLIGNYRNIDIVPKEICLLNVGVNDTVRGIRFTNKPFHPISMGWQWNSEKSSLYPNIVFNEVTNGIGGATEQIPAETIDVPELPTVPVIIIPPFNFPIIPVMKTYTWVINTPAVGGIPGPFVSNNKIVSRIDFYCVDGTSVTFNIEKRSLVGTPGANIVVVDMVASTSNGVSISPSGGLIPNMTWLWLDISGVDGAVTNFVVTMTVVG